MKNTYLVRKMCIIGVMAALATVLSFVQFPFPMAPYMKFDPNDIIILLCITCLSWKMTLSVISIRSIIRFLLTGGIFGEIAAFSSSVIFMSTYHILHRYLTSRLNNKVIKYVSSCTVAILVATLSLMILNYTFITPSNITHKFTTGWELMDLYGMSNKVYINTFIIPVMAFNLIKWSIISIINGLVRIKLPQRYSDTNIFIKSYELNNIENKENEYIKNEN